MGHTLLSCITSEKASNLKFQKRFLMQREAETIKKEEEEQEVEEEVIDKEP